MPKPPESVHREALKASFEAGIREAGDALPDLGAAFEVYAWTEGFYGTTRDFAIGAKPVERLIATPAASDLDIREANSLGRRVQRALFRFGDAFPFLIPYFASERQRLHIRDLQRYASGRDGAAEKIRNGLERQLAAASAAGRPILLIGHSMGSVICWDTLWDWARRDPHPAPVSLFLTMGSPLGQRYVQQRLLSHRSPRNKRAGGFPASIGRWVNLAAAGDMTSLDQRLANDFRRRFPDQQQLIEDHSIVNAFRLDGILNPHAEYGYLANAFTARIVVDWWRALDR